MYIVHYGSSKVLQCLFSLQSGVQHNSIVFPKMTKGSYSEIIADHVCMS